MPRALAARVFPRGGCSSLSSSTAFVKTLTKAFAMSCATLSLLATLACQSDNARVTGPAGQSAFTRFVAIGTDFSMGVQSGGIDYSTQLNAWPALLAHQAFGQSFTQPLLVSIPGTSPPASDPTAQPPYPPIASGCPSPLIAPLSFNRRVSGAILGVDTASVLGVVLTGVTAADVACTAYPDDTLPVNDVALDGATTYDAVFWTPDSARVAGFNANKLYALTLPPKQTQLMAALGQRPTLVSVELGVNEVLSAVTSGLVTQATQYPADGTVVPASIWQPVYQRIVDSLATRGTAVMLVGVPNVAQLPSLWTGDAIYQARADGLAYGIVVSSDCSGSQNVLFVPAIIPALAAQAAASGGTVTLSCADQPGTEDHILTPGDLTTITTAVSAMNSAIQSAAQAHRWAYVDVTPVLQAEIADRPAFSFSALLSSTYPYGQYVSLDGIHLNNQGQQLIANAAADALNAQYGFKLPHTTLMGTGTATLLHQ